MQGGDGAGEKPDTLRGETEDEDEGGLGWALPHTVRGFLASFSTLVRLGTRRDLHYVLLCLFPSFTRIQIQLLEIDLVDYKFLINVIRAVRVI